MAGILESVGKSRRLHNWIDSFLEYTVALPSPELFRKWTAISLLSCAMEKKVWARTRGSFLYPNLYVVLVGPPGVGKSAIISQAEKMLRSVSEIHIAPSSVTTASLVDALGEASRKILRPNSNPNFLQFNSLQVISSEFSMFLPVYESSYVSMLTKLYDGELYEERRRTGRVQQIRIDSTLLSILGGTTPPYLNSQLPESAWDQGFCSRTIFVFSGLPIHSEIFPGDDGDIGRIEAGFVGLVHDLRIIAQVSGEFKWSEGSRQDIVQWDREELRPFPTHAKLLHYNSRRLAHTLKLSMVASIARSSSLIVEVEDFRLARDWILEAEKLMPDIFLSMGGSSEAKAMDDCWYFIFEKYVKSKQPVSEALIVNFLRNRIASYQVMKSIEIMVRSGMLKLEFNQNGTASYIPIKH